MCCAFFRELRREFFVLAFSGELGGESACSEFLPTGTTDFEILNSVT